MKRAHFSATARRTDEADEMVVGLVDALFAQDDVGVAICDRELRYARVNSAHAAMNGCTPEDHVGRTVVEVLPQFGPELHALMREVGETDTPAIGLELSGETPSDPGSERHWRGSYYPIHGATGEVIGIGAFVIETTKHKRAEEALTRRERDTAYLAKVSAALSTSLDAKLTLRKIARLAVPQIADWCVVDMLQPDGSLRRVALAHADPAKEDLAWDWTGRYPSGPDAFEGTPKAIRSSFRELVPDVPDALLERIAQDERHLEILRELGLRSLMIVPLVARGRTLGAIGLVAAQSGRRYDRHDLALAQNLADRCALAVENARLFEERSRIADTLARSVLPPRLPQLAGVDLAARYRAGAAELAVGGDFYDVFALPGDGFAAAIGDVTGKGADAAAQTALARQTLRAVATYEHSASGALRALNDVLVEGLDVEERRPRFLTAAFARFERSGERLAMEVSIGGHPHPLIVRADGTVERAGVRGTLLGFDRDASLSDARHELRPGDAVVLYTDGLIEQRPADTPLDEDGLAAMLARCGGLSAEAIVERVEAAAVGRVDPDDDIALLVVKYAA